MSIGPRPAPATLAVARALSLSGGQYALGTGNYHPVGDPPVDVPWTSRASDGLIGCDCAGLICWAFKLPRHRPGYNHGGKYDVEDDLNSNSFLGDAFGARELFRLVGDLPQPGDVIAYPSFYLYGPDGKRLCRDDGTPMHWIGHVALVVDVSRVVASEWNPTQPTFRHLDIVQVKGPDRRSPAAIRTDASLFDHHNETWPKDAQRAFLLRSVQP